ncbi:MAG: methylated-DNA--[protein]-cysteine S-methyltransferase [Rhodobacter sp.]|nr:methylated-DNA--[protein]-cysteine S-methyltransferase [Rhodobacter sp.]
MNRLSLDSPLGPLTLLEKDGAVAQLDWGVSADDVPVPQALTRARDQLREYFDGQREAFDLPLAPRGNDFQRRFYAALIAIPFGRTRTYGELATDLGVSPQAIGQACGANPIPILIPCHRVLAADGLGGFSGKGGVETKVWLLKHEGAASLLI